MKLGFFDDIGKLFHLGHKISGDVPWYLTGGVNLSDVVGAYQAEGAASLAASYINLANPGTRDLTTSSAPTWNTTDGWIFSGEPNYLETGVIPVSGMSAIIKFTNVSAVDDRYLFGSATQGVLDGDVKFLIIPRLSGTQVRYGNGTVIAVAPNIVEGVLAVAGTKAYRNGVAESGAMGALTGTSEHSINIGRLNRATPTGWINARVQAFALYSTILTPAQVSAITDAIESPFEPTPAAAGEFLLAHMTDTHYGDSDKAIIHENMGAYVASINADVVIHTGDLVYSPVETGTFGQFESSNRMISNLNTENVPYLISVGNHDYDGDIGSDVIGRSSTRFNATFPTGSYVSKDWWNGDFYETGKTENAYLIMELESTNWIFISLEFGPRNNVLTWLDGLLTTHADKHAIISTHSFLFRDGTTVDSGDQYAPNPDYTLDGDRNNGDDIWNVIKAHDNIRLVLSGHDKTSGVGVYANREDNSDGGVPINQVVANYQTYFSYGSGMMRFLRINPTAKTIKVETFSNYLNMFLHDAANEFTVDWTP